jgi:hypothetical protein
VEWLGYSQQADCIRATLVVQKYRLQHNVRLCIQATPSNAGN